MTYFAANQTDSQIAKRTMDVVEYRKPSFGSFYIASKVQYWFGISKAVSFPGLIMDINHYVSMNVAKDNNPVTSINYNRQVGIIYSSNENMMPEKLFSNPNDPNRPLGISAVRALAIANAQGQKIYTLNAANQANHASLLAQVTIDAQAMTEIQNALAAGKEVTVHQAPITQSGWTGSGYIITDPATGTGAYKIAGGANGVFYSLIGLALGLISGATIILAGPVVMGLVGVIGFVIGVFYSLTLDAKDLLNFSAARFLGTIAGMALAVIIGGYTIISLPALFLLGILALMIAIVRLMIVELYTMLAEVPRIQIYRERVA